MRKETDWNTYYSNRVSSKNVTRKITEKLILLILKQHYSKSLCSIIEFGGGDSCFFQAFRTAYPEAYYTIIDKSSAGVQKFRDKHACSNVTAIEGDLLSLPLLNKADLVFSVGLIEHFDIKNTAQIIKAHFDAVLPTGLVLITYPTPSWSYKIIRKSAELLGIWRFHDERPLKDSEVIREIEKQGVVLFHKTNWMIGLTQKIVLASKVCKKSVN